MVGLQACMCANIVEKAIELGATSLVDFLVAAQLNGTIADGGPFTVFAPTNAAFDALPDDLKTELGNNLTLLQDVLKYHVVSGSVMSSALSNDMLVDTLDTGNMLRVNIYGSKVLISGGEVTAVDQEASNGVIHVIDKVLMAPMGNVVEYAQANSDFSTLVTAVVAADLVASLSGGNLTVFAPTNDAFSKVDNLDEILADKELLTSILTYHVVPTTVYSAGLSNNMEVTTLNGAEVKITLTGSTVKVNDATVVLANVPVKNGVIHAIDAVILPETSSGRTLTASLFALLLANILAFVGRY